MRNAGLEEAQAGIKIAGRDINHLRHADDTTLMAESEEELKGLDESEWGEWKSWLKAQHSENEDHGIWSHHFMANRWGNSGNSVRLFFGAPKSLQMVTAAMKLKDTCCLEEKLDQIRSVAQSCLTLCDPMNRSTPGLPVHHQLRIHQTPYIYRRVCVLCFLYVSVFL